MISRISLLLAFSVSMTLQANGNESDTTKALLFKAKEITEKATFKSEMDIVQHGKQNK